MSLNQLYDVVGITKQAVHQYQKRQAIFDQKVFDLLLEVDELRNQHPGCGVEKMYTTLQPDFIGRDRFVELFMELGYRVKKIKNYHRTTVPASYKYPNLIEGLVITKENTVWQSDITYFELNGRFYYIVFIIDVYSRKIVGYNVADNLRADANLKALRMALRSRPAPKIHHSDRGSQYIDKRYIKMLKSNGAAISMGLQAQDNAYAERVNGIIKNEYLKLRDIKSFYQLCKNVCKDVDHYNNKRKHLSLPNRMSPVDFEANKTKNQMIEMIYAPKRSIPVERSLNWNETMNKNDLFCII
jgi:hypothetical protein